MSDVTGEAADRAAAVARRMADLRTDYRASLPERAARIAALWSRYRADGDRKVGHEARDLVHRLAGTASVFGIAELGLAAHDVEAEMQRALDGLASVDDGVRRMLDLMGLNPPTASNSS